MAVKEYGEIPNLIKMREDRDVVGLSTCTNEMFAAFSDVAWAENGKEVKVLDLRRHVEPWLTALFQSEHLSLLVGTGLTSAACYAAGGKPRAMEDKPFDHYGDKINKAAEMSAKLLGRGARNFEDTIRVANELLRGMRIQGIGNAADKLETEINGKLSGLVKDLLVNEAIIKNDVGGESWRLLGNFLMSFSARSAGKDRLNLFTTNYDRVLEETADVIGLRFVDRFVGSLSPVFRASRLDVDYHYNPPGIRGEPRYLEGVVRFTKMHGSLDWVQHGNLIRRVGVPFGADDVTPYLREGQTFDRREYIIYPNSAKDRDTAEYPYVDLFRDFAAAICRPNSTLVTYGYGFGDSHINRIIEDSLTIASTHLVILSYDQSNGRILKFYEQCRSKSQISLLVGKDVASLAALTDYYLPRPAIDTAMERMAKVLTDRRVFEVVPEKV